MSETVTITRLGQPKTINYTNKKTGKPDSFQKIGFLTAEYGDVWHDFTYRTAHNLTVGQKLEVERTSREYNGKTYWDAKLPKKSEGNDSAVMDLLTRNNSGIQNIELLLHEVLAHQKSLEERVDKLVGDDGGEDYSASGYDAGRGPEF